MDVADPPQLTRHRLGRSVSVGLLLTSIVWIAAWITFTIVARRADSLAKIKWANDAILVGGIAMIAMGALAAWLAMDELAAKQKKTLIIISGWLWLTAGLVALGRSWSYWPWLEILIGTAALLTTVTIFLFRRRK